MKTIAKTLSILACGAAFAAPRISRADESLGYDSYAWHEDRLQSSIGVSTILGGGLSGFTDHNMRDVMSSGVSGLWDLRITIGSHIPLALDLGYVGTAGSINSLNGTTFGTLIGTTAEAALRYNILPHFEWNPYVFAGVGYQRYDVTGQTFQQADTGVKQSDNSVVYPMGAGIAYRDTTGLVLDLHGTFRANSGYGLVLENLNSSTYAPMHTWEASFAAGYEF